MLLTIFFINIGPELCKTISTTEQNPTSYIQNRIQDTIFIEPTSEYEIEQIILSLKNTSPGWDNILPNIIKQSYQSLITPLTHIFNIYHLPQA